MIQSLNKVLVISNYLLNKQEMTIRYCENKAKPALNCQGMCHLKKLLAEENDESRVPTVELNEMVLFHKDSEDLIQWPIAYKLQRFRECLSFEINDYPKAIFHPPSNLRS
jgi:hypothetical protein